MSQYTQIGRRMAVHTVLGRDGLLLTGFQGQEELSSPFAFDLNLMSATPGVDGRRLIGTAASFYVMDADNEPRWFHGIVRRFGSLGRNDRLSLYRAEVVPWTWLLSKRTDNRVFQFKTTEEIVTDVFRRAGHHDFRFEIVGKLPVREYCVQYGESDLDFVSRLLEDDGLFYFFDHGETKHTLVISDHQGAFLATKEQSVRMGSNLSGPQRSDQLLEWEHAHQLFSGDWSLRDFSFRIPSPDGIDMLHSRAAIGQHPVSDSLCRYEYPGGYGDRYLGEHRVRLRMDAEEATREAVAVRTICRTFSPGVRFRIDDHHDKQEIGREYVVRRVEHRAELPGAYLTGAETDRVDYENRLEAFPVELHFRPERRTPRPVMRGPQTATVVGPEGQEVYIDDHARVKVQFHWDREGRYDESSSCWVRVSQLWAGRSLGWLCHPRIGQEVIVDFLDGDPDRPIVVGRVYNAEQTPHASTAGASELKRMKDKKSAVNKQAAAASAPPAKHAPDDDSPDAEPDPSKPAAKGDAVLAAMKAALPSGLADIAKAGSANPPSEADGQPVSAAYMMSPLKSESLGGGGGANEITMNDSGGSEGLFFKAQKDEIHTVGNDQTESVGNDQMGEIGNDRTVTIGNDDTLTVGANRTVTVGSSQGVTVGKNKTEKVAIASNEMVGVMKTTTVGATYAVTVGGAHALTVGAVMNTAVGLTSTEQVGVSKIISVGSSIEIVCGASKITMDSGGKIVIEGTDVSIKSSGPLAAEAGGGISMSGGPSVTVKAGVIDLN